MIKTPLAPFGLEVSGLDITTLSGPSFDSIARLIAGARVVVFREQVLDDLAFVRFLKGLGQLTFTVGEIPVEHAADLNVVSNRGRLSPPRSVFHTDTSYVVCPPSFTALRPVVLPASGGDTIFSDQVGAAASLPQNIRRYLDGRTVLHGVSGLEGRIEGESEGKSEGKSEGQSATTRQPLFRRHALTGEVSLFLSTPQRCTGLSGVDAPTSERIIAALYRYSTRASKLYRHQWKAGDVLIWDNRVTMHKADHGNVTEDRVLHRGMVMGETPSMA